MERPLTHDSTRSASSSSRKIELPWLILAALLLSTLLAAFQSSRQLRADADARFEEISQREKRSLLRQLRDVENLLQGAKAFATTLPNLSQATWSTYVGTRMRDSAMYPGVIAIQLIPNAGSISVSLTWTNLPVPTLSGNLALWRTSPALVDAINKAALTNALVMSQSLPIMEGIPTPSSFVALALPLNSGGTGAALTSVQSTGTVLAIVNLAALVSAMERNPVYPVIRELFDGEKRLFPPLDPSPEEVSNAELSVNLPVTFRGRTFQLKISSTPQLEKQLRSDLPRTILIIGIFGTMLLGALVLLLTRLRQQAESLAASMTRKLQDQARFTEDLIEFNPNPIFRKDSAGRFVAVNQAWEQLVGRDRKDILGKTSQELQSLGAGVQSETHDGEFLASQTGYEASEVRFTNADGREFETITAKKVLKRADGSVDGMIGTITDVTLIKNLERELARQREQLDLVIRSSQQGIWDIDLAAEGTTYYSDRFREILGYADGDFPSVFAWQDHVHPDDHAEVRHRVIAHFKGLTALFDIESRVKRKDGSYMWLRVRAIAQRNTHQRAVRFVGSISDVTDRKLAEVELLEANIRVTEAARAKESFLATMSHEIRTPLNGVLGMTSLLGETNLNDEQRDYIHLIRSSGDTLLRLIDDVLDFSKIESGHMTLESVPVEILPLVEEAFELVAEKAREKGLALLFDFREEVPFYILGDATRLRQILLNLLSNAIKFTQKGEIKLVLTTRQTAGAKLELEGRLSDTGIGIPPERADKLFQPFTQVDASTTRKYGGTGLGLAIVRRLSQLMGGDASVESVEGQGSTFIFTFLTSAVSGPQKPYMLRDVAAFLGKRVLVVDRSADRRKIQLLWYSRWGFDTVTAAPEEAVDAFRRIPPFDVLVTEMEISSTDSSDMHLALEVDDRERRRVGVAPLSVILLSSTSRAELSLTQRAPTIRHDAFLMRPTSRGKIFDVLMRAVSGEPNTDIATRPFTPAQLQEPAHQDGFSVGHAATGLGAHPDTHPENSRRRLSPVTINGSPPRILVAEDNEVNQHVILGMLKNLGCNTDLACDGSVAVKMAIAGHYDVILLDIQMPILDGVSAMQNIRAMLPAATCPPIVAMTAHALSGDRERYLALGMTDYVSKPIRPGDLNQLFERILPVESAPQTTYSELQLSTVLAQTRGPGVPATALPLLDTEQLEDLRYLPAAADSGSKEHGTIGGLIRLFQTKADERIAEMEKLLTTGAWSPLADSAHSLRGSAASMGFPRVAARCKDLELAARGMQADRPFRASAGENLDEILASIKLHLAEANIALDQWLATNRAARDQ